jgi:hypothetical protein
MGEFSFVLAAEALDEGLFDEQLNEAVLAGVLTSVAASPFLFLARHRLTRYLSKAPVWGRLGSRRDDREEAAGMINHAVVCGFDEAGNEIVSVLMQRGFRCLVIDGTR